MAFSKLHDEYWAVSLESLGLDTLSDTETSKPCIIPKHGLAVHKFDILLHTYIHRVYLPTVPFQMAKPSDLPRGRAIEKIIFLNMIFLDFS